MGQRPSGLLPALPACRSVHATLLSGARPAARCLQGSQGKQGHPSEEDGSLESKCILERSLGDAGKQLQQKEAPALAWGSGSRERSHMFTHGNYIFCTAKNCSQLFSHADCWLCGGATCSLARTGIVTMNPRSHLYAANCPATSSEGNSCRGIHGQQTSMENWL